VGRDVRVCLTVTIIAFADLPRFAGRWALIHSRPKVKQTSYQKSLEKNDDDHEYKRSKVNRTNPCRDFSRYSVGDRVNKIIDNPYCRVIRVGLDPGQDGPYQDYPEVDSK